MKDGGPAFSRPLAQDGMSLRDWFAGIVLPAAVESYTLACRTGNIFGKPELPKFSETGNVQSAAVARIAYSLADAMLVEREKVVDANQQS